MHALPTTLIALILSMTSTTTAAASGNAGGMPQATQYVDSSSNITFLGYANRGFQFGMALPSDPKDDLIVQLVSPLRDRGGWGAVDFGESMTGHLLLVAWPNTAKENSVMISPRIATGYEMANGANVYNSNPINITQLPYGTFVNETHVSATFICGGCLNPDSFDATNATATLSYAYAYEPVVDPSDVNTQLSDHTANGEPYGAFHVTLAQAEAGEYPTWAALAKPAGGGAAPAETGASSGSGAPSSPPSAAGSSAPPKDYAHTSGLSLGAIFALAGIGLIYMLQAVQII